MVLRNLDLRHAKTSFCLIAYALCGLSNLRNESLFAARTRISNITMFNVLTITLMKLKSVINLGVMTKEKRYYKVTIEHYATVSKMIFKPYGWAMEQVVTLKGKERNGNIAELIRKYSRF